MKLKFHKNFEKAFKKLHKDLKEKVILTIEKFANNPHDQILKNHELKAHLRGKRAISVTSNLRIIFQEYDHYVIVIFLDVGNHNQVY